MKKKLLLIPLALLLAISLVASGCPAPPEEPTPPITPTEPTTPTPPAPEVFKVKMVTSTVFAGTVRERLEALAKMVEERSNGRLIIDLLGGAEIIPGDEQPEAIRTQVVDASFIVSVRWQSYVPAITLMDTGGPQVTSEVLREGGYIDYINQRLGEEANVMLLGGLITDYFNLWTNVPVKRREDLAKLRLAVVHTTIPFTKAIGAAPITIPVPEQAMALKRGLADGIVAPIHVVYATHQYEVTKYFIDHPFYTAPAAGMIVAINLDSLNSLPKDMQNILREVMLEMEEKAERDGYDNFYVPFRQKIIDYGVEPIVFSPEDAEWLVNTYFEAKREVGRQVMGDEVYNKVSKMMFRE